MTFDDLRKANTERCEDAFHPLDAWSLTDWACAAAGEMGEACNIVKKLRRLDIGSGFVRSGAENRFGLHGDLAAELADTVVYIDLLAARAGIDLGEAVRLTFNAVSDRVGSRVRL